ncbi:MAG TPA: hypothetical protein VII69_09680 [Candidatus Eremiobacteraceae bacterium]
MRPAIPALVLTAAATLTLLSGCAGGPAFTPKPYVQQSVVRSPMTRIPAAVGPLGMLSVHPTVGHHFKGFDTCPAAGPIEYISDFNNNVVEIFAGKFAGQAACGQIAETLQSPQGLFVGPNGNLYVANTGAGNILVFHRGATTHFTTYTDPTGQYPVDVTVAHDKTVIASNLLKQDGSAAGSISTWTKSGTFVGNYPMVHDLEGLFLTVQADGTLYYNDIDATLGQGLLWTGSCPAGVCGKFTSTGAVSVFPGGLRSAQSEAVVQVDQILLTVTTFQSFPNFTFCVIIGNGIVGPIGMDINKSEKHLFYGDAGGVGGEIKYPTCAAIGTVPMQAGALPIGAASDPHEPL